MSSNDQNLVPAGPLLPGQSWSLARKREVVLRLLGGEPIDALSRELGVEIYHLERWRDRALAGMDKRGAWRNIDDVEFATLEWVDWFNNRRLLEPIGDIQPKIPRHGLSSRDARG